MSTVSEKFDNMIENYFGIKLGENALVFIKTGRGGTISGYHNKYLKLANQIHDKYGFAVVVSANPLEYDCDLVSEINYIFGNISYFDQIYFMGVSNGALIGAQQCWLIPEIKRMLLINGPLMINLHKTIAGLKKHTADDVCIVYGDKDPSYQYSQLLNIENISNVRVLTIPGADHNFSGMEEAVKILVYNELLKKFI